MKERFEIFEAETDSDSYGVCEADSGAILYEACFDRGTAELICYMENSDNPPKDWEETSKRLGWA
jgi:hypothetical protein